MHALVPALVAVLGLVAAMPAMAAPRQAGFPNEVQAVIAEARKECREADGKGVTLKQGAIKKLDLNGDGRSDYAVDLAHVRCRGAESVYCGTGGCTLTLMIAQPDGALKTIFQGYVRTYTIAPQRNSKPAPRSIRFDLHGSACGKVGADMCFKTQTITGEPFDFKDKN
jgi:hypothetical protein